MIKQLLASLRKSVLLIPILLFALCWLASRGKNHANSPQVTTSPAAPPVETSLPIQEGELRSLISKKIGAEARALAGAGEPIAPQFLEEIVHGNGVRLTLPDKSIVVGEILLRESDDKGLVYVHASIQQPAPGTLYIQRQTAAGVLGPFFGHIIFDGRQEAWNIEPTDDLTSARFVPRPIDEIMCVGLALAPEFAQAEEETTNDVQFAPQTHPTNIPIPYYQPVTPLQSLPGAIGVIYLDFDGEKGPFPGWTTKDVAPSSATNAQIFDIWKRVCEDYQGFNLNITTDRNVFDKAPPGRRQQIIITSTYPGPPGSAGVAKSGTFNSAPSTPCWSVDGTGKYVAEVISHEIGHTLRLNHDGRTDPVGTYYGGHGTDPVGWAPIMGTGYSKQLTQWSKGEYLNANNTAQDDLLIIAENNNDVGYRADDYGDTLATAGYLEIMPDNKVSNEGIIEKTGDVDAFRFQTTGGSIKLAINPVTQGPNLDIHAELLNAQTLALIVENNPLNAINANLSMTLSAGEYLLRVRGTGRGDPLGDGYTNYGSLGTYLITGTVNGGVKPVRFSIAENTTAGTQVGTVTPRNNHAGAPLTYSIISGNLNGAFSINSSTGALTVANPSALNFEALSSRWDIPAVIASFVTITNPSNPALNETLRVVVQILDVNEAPSILLPPFTMLERTSPGTLLATAIGSDPDRFQLLSYSIVAGNSDGAFALDANSGEITVAVPIEVAQTTTRQLTVAVTDSHNPPKTTNHSVTVTVIAHDSPTPPGTIIRTVYENISGTKVTNLTSSPSYPSSPDREIRLNAFDGGELKDNYGSAIRGYLIVPVTGEYRFYIASDDQSSLYFASNGNPASATQIAYLSNSTNRYQWTKFSNQLSAPIMLEQGQVCYIEALHKESTNTDHVAVAWTGPLNATPTVISGRYLAPSIYQNYPPKITATTFTIRENLIPSQTVGFVQPIDANVDETFTNFEILDASSQSHFAIDPATGRITITKPLDIALSPVTLNVRVSDRGTPALTATGTITIEIKPFDEIFTTSIVQQIWSNVTGSSVANLTSQPTYPLRPSNTRFLPNGFDSGLNYDDNYGSRIRAYVIPPTTGNYTFYITSDDNSQLLMSNDSSPAGALPIAEVTSWSDPNSWTQFPSQTSAPRQLIAGQRYYIETLHKEGGGGDHVRVAWTGPDIIEPTVIPASALQTFDINLPPIFTPASYNFALDASLPIGTQIGTLTANDPEEEPLAFAITAGNQLGHFAIDPTGRLTLASTHQLSNGNVQLTVIAQDQGINRLYTHKSATATVTIQVSNASNVLPFPDPMTWSSPPTATSSSSVAMTATTATGNGGVEYLFECLTPGGPSSGWQNSPTFTSSGLLPGGTFSYRVKVRDKSPQANETGWSPTASVTLPRRPTITGGEVTIENGYVTHTFRQIGNSQLTLQGDGSLLVDVLIVAGGGGGGSGTAFKTAGAGGGGAGGVIYRQGMIISESTSISIGDGGAGGSGGNVPGGNGGISSVGSLIALGGGGGAGGNVAGKDGGSGGGGRGAAGGNALQPNATHAGYGNSGAAWPSNSGHGAGGGGGAGSAAPGPNPATVGGPGGEGRAFDISGILTHYAGGGGGGGSGTSAFGVGGIGGGGHGGNNNTSPTAGTPNTGGGGGGGNNSKPGAAGGSGIVIIRYPMQNTDDFLSWSAQWPGIDLDDPAADFNGDGMTNGEKYIWGLDPTDASAIQPIISIPQPNHLSFIYKRRSSALTGRVFSVWTSSDLVEWKRDDTAVQSASPPDAQMIETVSVTLTPMTSNERLFVRVQAR